MAKRTKGAPGVPPAHPSSFRGRGKGEARHVFFAACTPGVEQVLGAELKEHRFAKAEAQVGGARFEGPASEGWRAVLRLGTAVRVYREIARFHAPDADALYAGAAEVAWEKLFAQNLTFAVDADVKHSSSFTHSGYAALKVKDAVADRMRHATGARPDVDPSRPDLRIFCLIRSGRCLLTLDLAGRSLHRRGYRKGSVEAPVSESLAAAAVRLTGWDRKSPFLDPFCGSGTILIEAGLQAAHIAPGLFADDYAFRRFPDFDAGRWEEMREEARREGRLPRKLILRGWDADPDAVTAARSNARAAGLSDLVRVEAGEVRDFRPTPGWGATVLSNPPYGVRLDEEEALLPLYREMGEIFRERCEGYAVHLFLHGRRLAKALALKPERYWPLVHGGLDVRLYRFRIR